MIETHRLGETRRAIRKYLDAMPDDEPVDLVFLASILANFDPNRRIPFWLVIAGDPSLGKSLLLGTITDWQYSTEMTTGASIGTMLSTKGDVEGLLEQIVRTDKRILTASDITQITSVHRNNTKEIHSQLIGIHDGYLKRQTGVSSRARIYEASQEKRIGFVAGGTVEEWYRFQREFQNVGTRFSTYFWRRPRSMERQTLDLTTVARSVLEELAPSERDAGHMGFRQQAHDAVQRFLNEAIAHILDLRKVKASDKNIHRIAHMVSIIIEAFGNDAGRRLTMRATELAKVLAFMRGDYEVQDSDMHVVYRFILSQIDPCEQEAIVACLVDGSFSIEDIMRASLRTRRVVTRAIVGDNRGREGIIGTRLFEQVKGCNSPKRWRFTADFRRRADALGFDPQILRNRSEPQSNQRVTKS